MRRFLSAAVAAVLAISLMPTASAMAEQGVGVSDSPTPVDAQPAQPGPGATVHAPVTVVRADVPWPATGEETIVLSGVRSAKVPKLGVALSKLRETATKSPSAVRVQVYDEGAAKASGQTSQQLLVTLRPEGKNSALEPLGVAIDINGVGARMGADWMSRAQLVQYTGCRVTKKQITECADEVELTSTVTASGVITGAVDPAADADVATRAGSTRATVLAVRAGPVGSTGDYRATNLSPASSWSAGANSGSFSWSYPIEVPVVASGLAPTIGVSYDSGSVDSKARGMNAQAEMIGDGFDLSGAGFIERRYLNCDIDKSTKDKGKATKLTQKKKGKKKKVAVKTQDLCWREDNAVLSMSGRSGDLVQDATSGQWRLRGDDGSRFERVGKPGDKDEYWILTTTAGTKYYFGSQASANSSLRVPVVGNHPGAKGGEAEPCYNKNYLKAVCDMVWRWNLDRVVDIHNNVIEYRYIKETNNYGFANNKIVKTYDRAAYLDYIAYGGRAKQWDSRMAINDFAAQVKFEVAERCDPSDRDCRADYHPGKADSPDANTLTYPDTPLDQECLASTGKVKKGKGCSQKAPTFFSRKMYTKVTTLVNDGGFRSVDEFVFDSSFEDPNYAKDGTRLANVESSQGDNPGTVHWDNERLWLNSVQHTALDGGKVNLPTVTLIPTESQANRVANPKSTSDENGPAVWEPSMRHFRLGEVHNGFGGVSKITYGAPDKNRDCEENDQPGKSEAALANNSRLCFPVVYRAPVPGSKKKREDQFEFFRKYVVNQITEETNVSADPAFQSMNPPAVVTRYEYLGYPQDGYKLTGRSLYGYDSASVARWDSRTWSRWRGFPTVRAYTGTSVSGNELDPNNVAGRTAANVTGPMSVTETTFFTGSNGDCANPTCTEKVTDVLTSSTGVKVPNDEAFAGMAFESTTFDGVNSISQQPVEKVDSKQLGLGGGVKGQPGKKLSTTVTKPWQSPPTATNTHKPKPLVARFVRAGDTTTTKFNNAGTAVATVSSTLKFADSTGLLVEATTDGGSAGKTCTKSSFVTSTASYIVGLPAEIITYDGACGSDEVLSGTRFMYDNAGAMQTSQALVKGQVTAVQSLFEGARYKTMGKYSYDEMGRVKSATDFSSSDPNGVTTSTEFTPAEGGVVSTIVNKVTATGVPAMTSTQKFNVGRGTLASSTDTNGKTTRAEYDAAGRLLRTFGPQADKPGESIMLAEYSYTFGKAGAPSKISSASLNATGKYSVTEQFFDGLLRPIQTQAQSMDDLSDNRLVATTMYDDRGIAIDSTSFTLVSGGLISQRSLLGRMADGVSRNAEAAVAGLVVVPTNKVDRWSRSVIDGAGRVASSWAADAAVTADGEVKERKVYQTSYGYDGLTKTIIPPAGATRTQVKVDALGRVNTLRQYTANTTMTSLSGAYQDTTYTYRADGALESMTDPANNTWSRQYDIRGNLVESVDPDAGRTTMTYNDAGELISTTDAEGNTVGYEYDALGRQTKVTGNGAVMATWAYDGVVTGQLSAATSYSNGEPYIQEVTGYNDLYQPTGGKVIIPDSEEGLTDTYTTSAQYAVDGSLKSATRPTIAGANAAELSYTFDENGLPASLKAGGETVVNLGDYTAWGESRYTQLGTEGMGILNRYLAGSRRLANQIMGTATADNNQGRPAVDTAQETLANIGYQYDSAGNITQISNTPSSTQQGLGADVQCFAYDALRRLIKATGSGGDCGSGASGAAGYVQEFGYDMATGNRTRVSTTTTAGTTVQNVSFAAGPAHAPSSTDDGQGMKWDKAGRLYEWTKPGQTISIAWDALGRMTKASGSAGETSNVYDASGNLLIRRDATSKTLFLGSTEIRWDRGTKKREVQYHLSWNGTPVAQQDGDGRLTFLGVSHQGTGQVAVDDEKQVSAARWSKPFGDLRGESGDWPSERGFLNAPQSADLGLTHLGAREYAAELGVFISPDPVMNLGDPQQWNAYAYANSNPTTMSDPDGLEPRPIHAGTAATQPAAPSSSSSFSSPHATQLGTSSSSSSSSSRPTQSSTRPAATTTAAPKADDDGGITGKLWGGLKKAGSWVKDTVTSMDATDWAVLGAGVACGLISGGTLAVACAAGVGAAAGAWEAHQNGTSMVKGALTGAGWGVAGVATGGAATVLLKGAVKVASPMLKAGLSRATGVAGRGTTQAATKTATPALAPVAKERNAVIGSNPAAAVEKVEAAGATTGAVARLTSPDGKISFMGVSGEPAKRLGLAHPGPNGVADDLGEMIEAAPQQAWSGWCAEVMCYHSAMESGYSLDELKGWTMEAWGVGATKAFKPRSDGTISPCNTCEYLGDAIL